MADDKEVVWHFHHSIIFKIKPTDDQIYGILDAFVDAVEKANAVTMGVMGECGEAECTFNPECREEHQDEPKL